MKRMICKCLVLLFLFPMDALGEGLGKALFIGDSHSYGAYGEILDQALRKKFSEVVSISSCGSSPSTWVSAQGKFNSTNCGFWRKSNTKEIRAKSHELQSFREELKSLEPDVVVISLGTNILASETSMKSELRHIQNMLLELKKNQKQCIWVGPPDLKKDPFRKNLKAGIHHIQSVVEAEGCAFVDSSLLTKYPEKGGDGIHYGPKDSALWGQAVRDKLLQLPVLNRQHKLSQSPSSSSSSKSNAPKGAQ